MRKYNFNEKYFEKIDDERKAYWLGFICADGHIGNSNKKTKSMRLRISVNNKDYCLLEEFKKDICADSVKIKTYTQKNKGCKDSVMSYIVLNSNKLCDDLEAFGLTNTKTYKMNFPKIDDCFKRHFFRGYFDGDGYLNLYKRKDYPNKYRYAFEIVGASKTMIYDLKNFLYENNIDTNIYTRNPKKSKNITQFNQTTETYRLITSSKKEIEKIIKLMYEESNLFLKRKFEIANKII